MVVGVGGGSGGDCEVARRVELLLDGVDEEAIANPQEGGGEDEDEDDLWIRAWDQETEHDETVLSIPSISEQETENNETVLSIPNTPEQDTESDETVLASIPNTAEVMVVAVGWW